MTALPTISIALYNRRQTESNQTCLNCRGAKEEDMVNRRQTESNQTCLNCRGAKEEDMVNRLTHNDLGGVFCYDIASSTTYNIIHRAFRRCQTMAPAEGSVRLYHP